MCHSIVLHPKRDALVSKRCQCCPANRPKALTQGSNPSHQITSYDQFKTDSFLSSNSFLKSLWSETTFVNGKKQGTHHFPLIRSKLTVPWQNISYPRQCIKTFPKTVLATSCASFSVSCVIRTTCALEAAVDIDAVCIDITVVCPIITFVHIWT